MKRRVYIETLWAETIEGETEDEIKEKAIKLWVKDWTLTEDIQICDKLKAAAKIEMRNT